MIKKSILIRLGIILGFFALSYAVMPALLEDKVVNQSDISGWMGMSHEKLEWDAAHSGDPALWTGSMFGGMPTAAIQSSTRGDWTQAVYDLLLTGKRPATYLFVSMLGAFLLMLSLGAGPWISAAAALAVTFCSYNFQIIQVGHNTKMQALAFLPWVLASLVFTYRRRKLPATIAGAVLFGLALSMQVKANHPQISYYLALMILIYVVVLIVSLLRSKKPLKQFFIASALLLAMGSAGIATNAVKLLPTMEYTPYSIRGGDGISGGRKGVSLNYATAWSYGWEELPNLAIPNYNGGASSGPLPMNSETVQLLKRAGQKNLAQVSRNLPTYWGPQPFTAGPMYMGAVTIFLFILALCYYKGKERWWAAAASLLAVFLALGSNFLPFTKFFYNFVPLYNKFRTVSMALVVLQFTLPVLGFLMLDRMMRSSDAPALLRRRAFAAGGITVVLFLVLALLQSLFGSFSAMSDISYSEDLADALATDRYSLLWKDSLRSMLFVAVAAAFLAWGSGKPSGSVPRKISAAVVCLAAVLDLMTVDSRYLGPEDFVTQKSFKSSFRMRPVDEAILADTDPSYRVLDLTVNVFNDSHPSYRHKNIGGYSPAKLRIYNDYISRRINGDIDSLMSSLSGAATIAEAEEAMPYLESLASLNCRYVIVGSELPPLRYPYARGNAWFESGEGSIELVKYTPNALKYSFESENGGLAVFSEVYYPAGWTAVVDGAEAEIGLYEGGRDSEGSIAPGLLRCIELPAGAHTLEMSFSPPSYKTGEAVSRASSILLFLLLAGSLCYAEIASRKEKQESSKNNEK
ncbi:MAG: hypothetical protein IJS66_02790 [Bacteroidales bacterium]|nr:hypothetical protein [Bacteroidales bacterium]